MKKGFTLAEVLITLGIIGVVAAMTMPVLMANYEKKQTTVKLQKAYSILSQSIKLSELDNDIVDNWDYSVDSKTFYEKYFKKYLKNVKEEKNFEQMKIITYINMNNNMAGDSMVAGRNTYNTILADGIILFFSEFITGEYRSIGVDINGYKKPNKIGKDYFVFTVQPKYGLTPYGFGKAYYSFGTQFDRNVILSSSNSHTCNRATTGLWCAALIMSDGWEIKNDYPW